MKTSAAESAVELDGVHLRLDGKAVLSDIRLALPRGVFLGIIGPNGGGKSTLARVMLGLIKPDRGKVAVFGRPPEEAFGRIGYLPQAPELDRRFPISVREAVLLGRLGLRRRGRLGRADRRAVAEALASSGLSDLADRPFGSLSRGQQQRALLARALVSGPELLVLDEPTAGIDTPAEAGFYELLNGLKGRITIILISHDIGVISSLVDWIACLNVRLFCHESPEILPEDLQRVYGCPVDMIAHGVPHRVVARHRQR